MGAMFRWLKDLWLGERALGRTVERATAVIANGNTNIFTVAGGRVLVTQIVGEVTIVFQGIALTVRLQSVPTAGTTRDICLGTDIQSFAVGDLVGITGIPTDALIPAAGVSSGTIPAQTQSVVVKSGVIRIVAATAGNTGSMRWTLKYVALDAGATVVPA